MSNKSRVSSLSRCASWPVPSQIRVQRCLLISMSTRCLSLQKAALWYWYGAAPGNIQLTAEVDQPLHVCVSDSAAGKLPPSHSVRSSQCIAVCSQMTLLVFISCYAYSVLFAPEAASAVF